PPEQELPVVSSASAGCAMRLLPWRHLDCLHRACLEWRRRLRVAPVPHWQHEACSTRFWPLCLAAALHRRCARHPLQGLPCSALTAHEPGEVRSVRLGSPRLSYGLRGERGHAESGIAWHTLPTGRASHAT